MTRNIRGATMFTLLTCSLATVNTGCSEVRYRDTVLSSGTIERIVVRGDVGIVELVPGEVARVDLAVRAPEGAAVIQHLQFDGILEVTSRCRTPVLCAVDSEVHVPAGVLAQVEIDRGEVWATGVGNLDVSVGQGNVDLDSTGSVTVQVGNGSVRVTGAPGERVRVAVGRGDISVHVPSGPWNIDVTAQEETVRGITPDRLAPGTLQLVAPLGRVTVRGSQPRQRDSGIQ